MNAERKTSPGTASCEPQLPVLRFSLKHLFFWVTAICVGMAVLVAAPSGDTVLALLLAASVIALHVLGTAIGTRLRDHASQQQAYAAEQQRHDRSPSAPIVSVSDLPQSTSPLHGRDRPLRSLRLCLTVGAVLGGSLGIIVLAATVGERTTLAGVAVGGISMAILGAWLAFIAASAWEILRQGWREAVAGHHDDNRRRPEG